MAMPSLSLFNNVIPSGFGLAFVILEEYYPFGVLYMILLASTIFLDFAQC
jgi:hypothetical protein